MTLAIIYRINKRYLEFTSISSIKLRVKTVLYNFRGFTVNDEIDVVYLSKHLFLLRTSFLGRGLDRSQYFAIDRNL